jgi:hypothetical protein
MTTNIVFLLFLFFKQKGGLCSDHTVPLKKEEPQAGRPTVPNIHSTADGYMAGTTLAHLPLPVSTTSTKTHILQMRYP